MSKWNLFLNNAKSRTCANKQAISGYKALLISKTKEYDTLKKKSFFNVKASNGIYRLPLNADNPFQTKPF